MVISHLIVDKSINSVAIIQSYLSINYRSFQYIYLIKRKILTAIKKIAIIGPSYPYKGGIAAFNDRMAEEFNASGYDVTMINYKLQYPKFLYPGSEQTFKNDKSLSYSSVRLINAFNPFNWIITGLKLRRNQFDVIIIRHWIPFMSVSLACIAQIAKWGNKSKIISIVDNLIPHEKRFGDYFFSKISLIPVDLCVTLSQSVKKDLEKFTHGDKKILLTPHPIYDQYGIKKTKNISAEFLQLPTDRMYMLFFGLVRKYKGLDILIEAFGLIKDKLPTLDLIVAGEFYEDASPYEHSISNNKLTHRVHLRKGFVAEEDVSYLFSISDLLVLPYKSGTQSGVAQISVNFSLPMLVTRVGGLPELVNLHGLGMVCEPNSEDMAIKLLEFFNNNKDYALNFTEAQEYYSWDSFNQKLINNL